MTDESLKQINAAMSRVWKEVCRTVMVEGKLDEDGTYTVTVDNETFKPYPPGANVFAIGGTQHRRYMTGEQAQEALASGEYVITGLVFPGKRKSEDREAGKQTVYELIAERRLYGLIERLNPLCEEKVSPWLSTWLSTKTFLR